MPPRHAYWTILIDNMPTAFRTARLDELQPTFERLRRKHPSAVVRWFARGRLWDSPEAARRPEVRSPARGKDWRPGGAHRDPRERVRARPSRWKAFREAKRARMPEGPPARGASKGVGAQPDRRPPGNRPRPGPSTRHGGSDPDRRHRRPHEEQPGLPRPPAPPPPPGPDRPPRPGTEPEPVPSKTEEIVIPPEPPERGARRAGSRQPQRRNRGR